MVEIYLSDPTSSKCHQCGKNFVEMETDETTSIRIYHCPDCTPGGLLFEEEEPCD